MSTQAMILNILDGALSKPLSKNNTVSPDGKEVLIYFKIWSQVMFFMAIVALIIEANR